MYYYLFFSLHRVFSCSLDPIVLTAFSKTLLKEMQTSFTNNWLEQTSIFFTCICLKLTIICQDLKLISYNLKVLIIFFSIYCILFSSVRPCAVSFFSVYDIVFFSRVRYRYSIQHQHHKCGFGVLLY